MRKLLTVLSFVLFAMMLPVSTYAATTHSTKHVKHVVHTVKKAKSKKTSKKKQGKTQQKKKQYGNGTVQGTSPYVIVGTLEPTKQFTWAVLMKQGPNWLNYTMANSKTTWSDPARY